MRGFFIFITFRFGSHKICKFVEKMKSISAIVSETYSVLFNQTPINIHQLPASASSRVYFRVVQTDGSSIIAAYSENKRENHSFITLTNHFLQYNIHVPKIIKVNPDNTIYFIEDLGNTTLFSIIQEQKKHVGFNEKQIFQYYEKAINELILMQTKASKNLPFEHCYPVAEFNQQAMLWDLNYFKYYFLKVSDIPFEEDYLEQDFQFMTQTLCERKSDFFMFRDFQSRNMMIHNDNVFLIDYQGGRKGPLTYDIASCILDAKADLSWEMRLQLTECYFSSLSKQIHISKDEFEKHLGTIMLLRIMQAFGAYGFRGYIEKKELFLQSIPYAARNLKYVLNNYIISTQTLYLFDILHRIADKFQTTKSKEQNFTLTVSIFSFSYKKGIPADSSSNGGGFVFDCRALPNPGRFPEFQTQTGFDSNVIKELEKHTQVSEFLTNVEALVKQSVQTYIERKFTHLQVAFGCTGGQHRSVYCVNTLAELIKKQFEVNVEIIHRELKNDEIIN
jgi:aminoglycoside/choline kinase family phosphotransferase